MGVDEFNFCLPLDVVKSEKGITDEWRIGGYASTSSEDRQGDEIIQKGLVILLITDGLIMTILKLYWGIPIKINVPLLKKDFM